MTQRPQRADARRDRDRILVTATRVIADEGPEIDCSTLIMDAATMLLHQAHRSGHVRSQE